MLEQMYMTMGMYEGVAELRVRQSLARTSNIERLREGVGRRVKAVALGDAIRLLERAADLYTQVASSPGPVWPHADGHLALKGGISTVSS